MSKLEKKANVAMEAAGVAAATLIGKDLAQTAAGLMTVATNPKTRRENDKEMRGFVDNVNKKLKNTIHLHYKDDLPTVKQDYKSNMLKGYQKSYRKAMLSPLGAYQTSKFLQDFTEGLDGIMADEMKKLDPKLAKNEKKINKAKTWEEAEEAWEAVMGDIEKMNDSVEEKSVKLEKKFIKEFGKSKDKDDSVSVTRRTPTNILAHEVGHAMNSVRKTPAEQVENVIRANALASAGAVAPTVAFLLSKNKKVRMLSAAVPLLGAAPLLSEEGLATIKGAKETAKQKDSFSAGFGSAMKNLSPYLTYLAMPAVATAIPIAATKLLARAAKSKALQKSVVKGTTNLEKARSHAVSKGLIRDKRMADRKAVSEALDFF